MYLIMCIYYILTQIQTDTFYRKFHIEIIHL